MNFPLMPVAIVLPLECLLTMRAVVNMITMLRVDMFVAIFRKSKGPGALRAFVLVGFGIEMFPVS